MADLLYNRSTRIKPSDSSKKMRMSHVTEVITIDSSSDDDDTTVDWESSSSDDDIQILEQRIRSRKVARTYQDKDKVMPKTTKSIHTRIYSNSSFPNSSTRISTGSLHAKSNPNSNSKTGMGSQPSGSFKRVTNQDNHIANREQVSLPNSKIAQISRMIEQYHGN